ncbi:MAG: dihydroxyacetone kinase subunit DhaL [Pauljensenia sp.]
MTTRVDAAWARRWITLAAADVASHRDYLIDLDRAIGDGDHGENMDRGFTAALAALESAEDADISGVLKTVAKTLMSTVGGAAGPLYGTAFLRASKAAAGGGELDGAGVAAIIAGALEGIQARGKATTGEKTMVDAWSPACEAARAAVAAGGDASAVLEAAETAAEAGARATEPLRATKGRASYLGERSIGHLDPGAVSTSLILRAAARAAAGQEGA